MVDNEPHAGRGIIFVCPECGEEVELTLLAAQLLDVIHKPLICKTCHVPMVR